MVAIDTPIDHPWISTCISWDNAKSGQMLGEYALKYIQENLKDKESINLIMLDGTGLPAPGKARRGLFESAGRREEPEPDCPAAPMQTVSFRPP